jgi:hypothetical protein
MDRYSVPFVTPSDLPWMLSPTAAPKVVVQFRKSILRVLKTEVTNEIDSDP